uniref:Putative glutathione S-transferase DHAR1, cytosolic (Trinotate prediction) n=1 Tax=Myxobolus squamalis TaxID=59785 RepID=A0A6B2G222_MYXSQ
MNCKLIVQENNTTGQVSADIITMRIQLYLYFKKIVPELALMTSTNRDLLLPSNTRGLKPPIFFDMDAEVYITDILEIESYLDKIPPNLTDSQTFEDVAPNIYSRFLVYAVKPTESILKSIEKEICAVETQLKKSGGPFLGGSEPCRADCILFPKLFHIERFFFFTGIEDIISSDKYPNVYQYYQMIYNLPNTEHIKSDRNSLVEFFKMKGVNPKKISNEMFMNIDILK